MSRLLVSDPPLQLRDEDIRVFVAATLLHDIGHYPFSHTLEELMPFFVLHEERARQIILDQDRPIYHILHTQFEIDPLRVANVIDYKNAAYSIPPEDLLLPISLAARSIQTKLTTYCAIHFSAACLLEKASTETVLHRQLNTIPSASVWP